MSNKSKGANAERELYQMFIDNTWRAVRVAGSGMLDNTSCDLIAGKPGKKYCIECKATKSMNKYITKQQIEEFLIFSETFGLMPVIAIKFNRKGWFFLKPEDLEDTGKFWALSLKTAMAKGKRFSQMFQDNRKSDEELYDELEQAD